MRKITTEQFIAKAQEVHGNKYDYSKSVYKAAKQKVIITCPAHGDFLQTPDAHLRQAQGCPKCKFSKLSIDRRKSIDAFIQQANAVHNHTYDYSQFEYINEKTKGIIICPKHGSFLQTPDNHLKGRGCPKCQASKGELFVQTYLEQMNIQYIRQYKIQIPEKNGNRKYVYIDFYLPNQNVFIEYNGKQHYMPVKHFGGELKFAQQIERDKYVRDYCNVKGISLIEIDYKQDTFDKVKDILNSFNLLTT